MRARAIVMPLRVAPRLDGVRQDGRDGPGRAPVPGDHPGRSDGLAREEPRRGPTRVASDRDDAGPSRASTRRHAPALGRDGPPRRRDARARRSRAAAARSATACCSASCSSPPAPGGCWVASRPDRQLMFRRGLGSPALFAIVYTSVASAIYFSLGVIGEHALGLTPVVFLIAGVLLRAGGDDLRRGRVAAPGARRLDRLRPLRLQRARQLHRGLGDPARLHDPHRGHGVLGHPLPRGLLRAARAWAAPELALRFGIIVYVAVRNIRGFSTSRVNRIAALVCADIGLQLMRDRRRAGGVLPRRRAAWTRSTSAPRRLGRHRLRARRRDRRLHRPGVGVGPVGRGPRRGAAASSAWSARVTAVVMVVYVGIAVVAVTALPVVGRRDVAGAQLPRGADARASPRRSDAAGSATP